MIHNFNIPSISEDSKLNPFLFKYPSIYHKIQLGHLKISTSKVDLFIIIDNNRMRS